MTEANSKDMVIKRRIKDILSGKGIALDCTVDGSRSILRAIRNNELICYVMTSGENDLNKCDAIAEEQKGLSAKMYEYIVMVQSAFHLKGLRFFTMKTVRSYQYADDDIDLVCVDRHRFGEYARTLEELGFISIWNQSMLREPGKHFFINKIGKDLGYPFLHVHRSVSWNGIDFLDAESVWRRLMTVNVTGTNFKVPSVEDEILIAAAHSLHENTYITAGEIFHIKSLLTSKIYGNIDVEYMIDTSKRYNWYPALRAYLSYLEACCEDITGAGLVPECISSGFRVHRVNAKPLSKEIPPYFIPPALLLPVYASKIIRDLLALRLFKIPREILTFGLVVWLLKGKKKSKFFAVVKT